MPSNVKKEASITAVYLRYILWPRKSKMHNLIFCCLCIVAASKDVGHRVSRADSNFKKNPKKVLRYDYILVMAITFQGAD